MSNIKDLQIGQGVELDLVFTQAPIAMAFFEGPEMVIKSANPMILDLWGKDAGIIGLKLLQALPELEGQPFPDLLDQVYQTGIEYKGYETLARIERKGILEDCYFNFIYSPLRDPLGNVIGVCAVATEVTEQVVAKMQLQASERRFKQFIFNADVATGFYTGRDMVIQVANDAMLQVWGKDASVIGKPLAEALPELQGQPFLDLLDRVYTTGETYKANADAVDLVVDGELQTFYYNFSYKALFDANGEVYGILNMAINVTEQELANRRLAESEMALLASEKNLQDLADSMPQIVWTASADGKLDYFNRQWYEFTGLEKEIIGDEAWLPLLHPDHAERVSRLWNESVKSGKVYETEYLLKEQHSDNYRWFLGRAVPVRNSHEAIVKWIGTNTDIHEFKMLQRQKDDFLGIASHELKTPLTSVKAYAQILESKLRKEGDASKTTLVNKMGRQINKLTSLVGDLLDVTRIEPGKLQFREEYFDLNLLAQEVIELMEASTSSHVVLTDFQPTPYVFADRDRIGQVITNLITNAIKYSPGAKKVNVSIQTTGERVQLAVQDFGIGIPADKKDMVFEQFYRVESSSGYSFAGLGLGLYISSEIIHRQKGKIWVESVEGQGSTFYFTLPCP